MCNWSNESRKLMRQKYSRKMVRISPIKYKLTYTGRSSVTLRSLYPKRATLRGIVWWNLEIRRDILKWTEMKGGVFEGDLYTSDHSERNKGIIGQNFKMVWKKKTVNTKKYFRNEGSNKQKVGMFVLS